MNFNLESNDWSDDTSGNATPLEYCVEDYVSGEVPDLDVDGDWEGSGVIDPVIDDAYWRW